VHRFNFEHRPATAFVDVSSDIHYRTGTPELGHGRERHRETTTELVEHISEETTHLIAGRGTVVIASTPSLDLADIVLRGPTATRHRRRHQRLPTRPNCSVTPTRTRDTEAAEEEA
jgi:hypothetical protein